MDRLKGSPTTTNEIVFSLPPLDVESADKNIVDTYIKILVSMGYPDTKVLKWSLTNESTYYSITVRYDSTMTINDVNMLTLINTNPVLFKDFQIGVDDGHLKVTLSLYKITTPVIVHSKITVITDLRKTEGPQEGNKKRRIDDSSKTD